MCSDKTAVLQVTAKDENETTNKFEIYLVHIRELMTQLYIKKPHQCTDKR